MDTWQQIHPINKSVLTEIFPLEINFWSSNPDKNHNIYRVVPFWNIEFSFSQSVSQNKKIETETVTETV